MEIIERDRSTYILACWDADILGFKALNSIYGGAGGNLMFLAFCGSSEKSVSTASVGAV